MFSGFVVLKLNFKYLIMDITVLFKACVKTVRTTNKALGLKDANKHTILTKTQKDVNLTRAREIVKQISGLHTFLQENKAAYLNVLKYLSTSKTMTEEDRQQVDSVAEKIVNSCSSLINEYKKEIQKMPKTPQKEEHYSNVMQSLERYLKEVSKEYTELKAVRVKRVIETHKLSKLEVTPKQNGLLKSDNNEQAHKADLNSKDSPPHSEFRLPPLPQIQPVENLEDELSPEEMQMFETENEQLFNELNSMSEEVKQMESKVVHIAQLQELFTEKVLQQEKDIERIATTVSNTTDNMRGANEQIRQAIQRNAGLRVWVLFFLLVMSFSLLFLDWYND